MAPPVRFHSRRSEQRFCDVTGIPKPLTMCFILRMHTGLTILLADDNEDDIELVRTALKRTGLTNPVHVCRDGQEVIAYLKGEKPYGDRAKYPFPRMLILDLKMPKLG